MRLIDADAVKDNIYEWLDVVGNVVIGKGFSYTWELEGCIDDAPTIEAEPVKHGRWVEHICFDDGFWICSNCKFVSQATAAPKLYRYCPNCGAKMDAEDEA